MEEELTANVAARESVEERLGERKVKVQNYEEEDGEAKSDVWRETVLFLKKGKKSNGGEDKKYIGETIGKIEKQGENRYWIWFRNR